MTNLAVTREWFREKIESDPDVETEAGVLHPEAQEDTLQTFDVSALRGKWGRAVSDDLGVKPGLAWLPVTALRIDKSYQREVLRAGMANIFKIARNFDWSLFGVIIVASVGDQLFAVVDGQHRVLAARLRDVSEVPCVIIDATPGKQAEAFAAINGSVTKISSLQVYHALVASGDPDSLRLKSIVSAARVTICRYPVMASNMKIGETVAIASLKRCLSIYGPQTLTLALKCLVSRGAESIGALGEPQIKAMCHVLDAEPDFARSEAALITSIRSFDFVVETEKIRVMMNASRGRAKRVSVELAKRLFEFLDEELGS